MCELLKIYNECPVTEDFILENLSFSTSLLLVFILYTCKGKIGLHLSGLKWAELPDLGRLVSSLQRWKAIQKLGWWPVPARLCWISAFPPSHPPATLWRDSALCVTILAHPVPQQVTLYLPEASFFRGQRALLICSTCFSPVTDSQEDQLERSPHPLPPLPLSWG